MHRGQAFSVKKSLEQCIRQSTRARNNPVTIPFLFQTRTLWQPSSSTPDEPEKSSSKWDERLKPIPEPPSSSEPGSTITDTERIVFAKLFKLAAKDTSTQTAFRSIMQPKAPLVRPQSTERDPGSGVQDLDPSRFPSSLRRQAESTQEKIAQTKWVAMAQRLTVAREQLLAQQLDDPLQPKREARREKVEAEIRKAPTDVALWDVLEAQLFGVMEQLDLDAPVQKMPALDRKASKRERRKERNEDEELGILGPIYSALLLVAMRELKQHFPASYLPLQLLPRIKEIGRASFTLGTSTALCNEHLQQLVEVGDFTGMDEMLAEMDNGGIDYDQETLDVLKAIKSVRQKDMGGRIQGIMAPVWAMQSQVNEFARLEQWQDIVKKQLREQDERHALLQAARYEQIVAEQTEATAGGLSSSHVT